MSRARSNMSPLWAPGFWVWLLFSFATVCKSSVGVNTASINNCYRKTCLERTYDVRKAACCENTFHEGAGLLCCGSLAFHPEAATCCKVANGHTVTAHVTEGLSEKVSACCGLKAYNLLNELCCESSVVTRPSPMSQCCGKEAFHEETEMCCGPIGNKTVLQRLSPNHKCCGHDQYDTKTQCCCSSNRIPEIHSLNFRSCQQGGKDVCGDVSSSSLSEHCCQSAVADKHSDTGRCGKGTFNKQKEMCCGPIGNRTILQRNSSHHQCCGHNQYDTRTQCCCSINKALHIRPLYDRCCHQSADLCGMKPYNTLNELCCQSTVVPKYTPNTKCCDNKAFDEGREMCCGPIGNRTILWRRSCHHQCCGHDQYNTDTQCCCGGNNNVLEIHPFHSKCCQRSSGVKQQLLQLQPVCSQQLLGGTTCCNPDEFVTCERDPAISPVHYTSGRSDGTPTQHNSCTHVCCGGKVFHRGGSRAQLHGSAELHCCGSHVYQPNTEICCDGHKYPREGNMHCCGTQAYSIQNQQMKCCAGTLHNLSVQSKLEVKCCGSLLQQAHHVCCSSGEEEVLYSNKKGFRCCGHQYFNTSLWSCCAGKLHPVNQTEDHPDPIIKDVMLRSVHNLERSHLCNEIFLGTVESVSLHSILFVDVLKINGMDGVVTPLPSPYIMKKSDCCSFLPLSPGKTYFYNENNIFADIDLQATLQAVHSIISSLCR